MKSPLRLITIGLALAALILVTLQEPSDQSESAGKLNPQSIDAGPRERDLTTTLHPRAESASNQHLQSNEEDHSHDFNYIQNALRRNVSQLNETEAADGTVAINLQGSYRTASMARRLPDGSIEVVCFENFGAAKNFLLNPPGSSNRTHSCEHCTITAEK